MLCVFFGCWQNFLHKMFVFKLNFLIVENFSNIIFGEIFYTLSVSLRTIYIYLSTRKFPTFNIRKTFPIVYKSCWYRYIIGFSVTWRFVWGFLGVYNWCFVRWIHTYDILTSFYTRYVCATFTCYMGEQPMLSDENCNLPQKRNKLLSLLRRHC